jgi:hypothetical protein
MYNTESWLMNFVDKKIRIIDWKKIRIPSSFPNTLLL